MQRLGPDDKEFYVSVQDLWEQYLTWCEDMGYEPGFDDHERVQWLLRVRLEGAKTGINKAGQTALNLRPAGAPEDDDEDHGDIPRPRQIILRADGTWADS